MVDYNFPFIIPGVPKRVETFDWAQNERLVFNYLINFL